MSPGTLVVVVAAAGIGAWAGSRWRHNRRTWADHRQAVTITRQLARLRWKTLRAALAATTIVAVCLAGAVLLTTGANPPLAPACTPDSTHPPRPTPCRTASP